MIEVERFVEAAYQNTFTKDMRDIILKKIGELRIKIGELEKQLVESNVRGNQWEGMFNLCLEEKNKLKGQLATLQIWKEDNQERCW